MNAVEFVYLLPAFFAFLWPVVTLVAKPHPTDAQWLVSGALFLTGCTLALYATYFSNNLTNEYFLNFLYLTLAPFCPPMFFVYFCRQTSLLGVSQHERWAFIPAIVAALFNVAVSIVSKARFGRLFLARAIQQGDYSLMGIWRYDIQIFATFLSLSVLVLGFIFVAHFGCYRIMVYNRLLNEFYACNGRRLVNRNWLVVLIGIAIVVVCIVSFLLSFVEIPPMPVNLFLSLAESLIFLSLGYFTYTLRFTAEEISQRIARSQQAYGSGRVLVGDGTTLALRQDIVTLVERNQGFLDPNLNVDILSHKVHVNQHVLINFIHEEFGCTFAEYVDGLRVSKAIGLLVTSQRSRSDSETLSTIRDYDYIESVALQCGFSSVPSFYQAFRLVMGQSFESWLRES